MKHRYFPAAAVIAFGLFASAAQAQTGGSMSGPSGSMQSHQTSEQPGCTKTANHTSGGMMASSDHMSGGAMSSTSSNNNMSGGDHMASNDHMTGGSMSGANHMASNNSMGCPPAPKSN